MIELATQKEITLTSLIKESLKLVLIGGKGGVGKTTTACSLALACAKEHPDRKILLVSTDPAHSISDSLGEEIRSGSTVITGFSNLKAQEINAKELYESFKLKNHNVIKKIMERGTYFDLEDINNFFDLSLPGLDELMALLEIARIVQSKLYDLIILDTAPAGHTLRLLQLPKLMRSVIELFELMQSKYRTIVKSLTHQYQQDDADLFIRNLTDELGTLSVLLKNVNSSRFIPVILPEGICVDETKWLANELIKLKMPLQHILVNRVIKPNDCPYVNQRAELQQKYLQQIQNTFKDSSIYQAPLFTKEIKGKEKLFEYFTSVELYEPIEIKKSSYTKSLFEGGLNFKKNCNRLPNFINLKRGLVIFAGKGGVGKTSMSLACGIHLASQNRDKKILVASIDPAHSLSSSLEIDAYGKIKEISKSLYVLEVDSLSLLEDFRKEYIDELKEFFENMSGEKNIKIEFDMEIIEKFLSLSPPGLDELMALNKIMEIQKEHNFDLIIIDSAPTGHLLRFLELPQLASDWVKSFIRILLKYRGFEQLHKTAQMVVNLSSDLRSIISKLKDNKKTELVAVTYPEAMAQDETKRLLIKLNELQVNCQNIIVNMVISKNSCEICVNIELGQKKSLATFIEDNQIKKYHLIEVPLAPQEVKGFNILSKLGRWLYE